MRYINKYLDGEHQFLEVTVYDYEDAQSLSQFWNEKNVITSVSNLQYLVKFKQIERLILTSGEIPDNVSEIVKTQQCLRALKIDYDETALSASLCIDISGFPNLEYLFSNSSFNFTGVSNSKTLKTLIVRNWYGDDLSKISHSQIDSLSICWGRLKTLKGIEDVPLQILSLANLRSLTNISYVEKLPLKILELVNCNNVTNLDNLSSNTLEYLMICGKNKVQSGAFIKKNKQIRRVMLDIMIEDGDLSMFDSLEKATILTDRRHYNRKNSQLPKNETQYVIDDIPMWRYIYSGRRI